MKNQILITFLVIILTACAPAQTNTVDIQNTAVAIVQADIALTQTALPTATLPPPTFTPTALPTSTPAATPIPTQPPVPILTPDAIQVERWREYQTELAKLVLSDLKTVVLSDSGSVVHSGASSSALCEWDILGRSGDEVYVWTICGDSGSVMEKPAVIYLEADGSIRDVKVVFNGPGAAAVIHELFPTDVQEKIYLYYRSGGTLNWSIETRKHLDYRLTHPEEPPLVVLSAMPIP